MSPSPTGSQAWVERAEIVARVNESFRRSGLSQAGSLRGLVEEVSRLHGKPIGIAATADTAWDTLTALWVDYPTKAQIFYRGSDSPLYQTHCVLHELAHIALQHPGCNVLRQQADLTRLAGADGVVRGRLLEQDPTGVPELATDERQVMEGEAECLAHLLSSTLFRPRFHADEDVFG